MKKNKFISLVLCVAMVLPALSMSGCTDKQSSEEKPFADSVDILISIDYPQRSELEDVKNEVFTIEEKSSVLEVIQLYCNVNEMPVTIETTGGVVVGINDLLNGDIFAARTWQFKVNGEFSDKPADEIMLKDGDSLEWVYLK